MKKQKGITLVALIITIVILLILAMVSINSIINDGIISKAEDAKNKYVESVKNEKNLLQQYLDKMDILNGNPTTNMWTQTGTSVTNGKVTLTVGTTVTGYDAGVSSYTGGWAVLGAQKGRLLLVSKTNVETEVKLGGNIGSDANTSLVTYVAGYSNGVSYLNTLCAAYKNDTLADEARSIDVDDINRITGYNPEATGNGKIYDEGIVSQYGNKVTFTINSEGKLAYSSDVASGTTIQTTFKMPDGTTLTKDMLDGISVTSNNYYYYPNTLTASNSGDTKGITTDSAAYSVLFNSTSQNGGAYWLASQTNGIMSGGVGATFGIRLVLKSAVSTGALLSTLMGKSTGSGVGARAVICLKSDINIDETGKIS